MNTLTTARPVIIGAITFRCYNTVGLRHIWKDDSGELTAYRYPNSVTYRGTVRGIKLKIVGGADKKFRSLKAAMKATVNEMEEQKFNGIWP